MSKFVDVATMFIKILRHPNSRCELECLMRRVADKMIIMRKAQDRQNDLNLFKSSTTESQHSLFKIFGNVLG